MPPKLPIEYAEAQIAVQQAWEEYDRLVEAGVPHEEIKIALQKALKAEARKDYWYRLWQEVGGTSNIKSIIDALRERDKECGRRFIISGGEVLEI